MIHFAMPQTLKLDRDLLLKAYWDGETAQDSADGILAIEVRNEREGSNAVLSIIEFVGVNQN